MAPRDVGSGNGGRGEVRDGLRPGRRTALISALASFGGGEGGGGSARVYLLIAVLSIVFITVLFWLRPGFLTGVNLKSLDAFFSMRGSLPAPSDVVVVAVDEPSINELGRWPWPRTVIARLVDKLALARTVAVDMVFSEPESVVADTALSSAIESAGNITLGYFFRSDSTERAHPEAERQLRASRIPLVSFTNGSRGKGAKDLPVPWFPTVEANTPAVGAHASSFGFFNVMPDTDGLYRTANLLAVYGGEPYPSLALRAAVDYLGGRQVMVSAAPYGVDSIRFGPVSVPVDERGGFTINYYDRSPSFTTISAVDLIEGRVPPGELRDKLVFVGVTETGVYDVRPTPLDALFPGVEIHATVAANIIEGRFLIRDTRVVIFDLIMLAVLPLVLVFVVARVQTAYLSLASFIIILALFVTGEFFIFSSMSIVPAPVYPVLSAALAYLGAEAYRNIVVERRSRYLKKAFSSYVSSELVTEIIRDPGRLKLGGEKRPVTVLFSDIRGFTTMSEEMAAEELVRLLNEYLSPMTGIVLEEEGMLDKYIGDAIMAIFNTPVEVADHPVRACRAALRMVTELDTLNRRWTADGYPRIDIGVGINTGEAVVGNMGAELRFDYTAIGDAVNLASRLEGMNKLYGTHIIVSEHTRALAEGFSFRELDTVRVKGKERGIVIYELVASPGNASPSVEGLIEKFSVALGLYRARRFEEAGTVFTGLAAGYDDGPSKLFASRCEAFIKEPPPDDWDGTYVATSK